MTLWEARGYGADCMEDFDIDKPWLDVSKSMIARERKYHMIHPYSFFR